MSLQFDNTEIVIDIIKNQTNDELKSILPTLKRNDINKLSPLGMAPIHHACLEGELEMVACLLQHSADPSLQDIEGWTPLHIAAATSNYELTVLLLSEGADPCVCNNDHDTASDVTEQEEFLSLLDTAAIAAFTEEEREETDSEEETALLAALREAHKHDNVSKWQESLDISEEGSLLHLAAAYGYSRLVQYICEENVMSLNTRDTDGWTPLHVASYWQQTDIALLLVCHGADTNITTKLYSKYTEM